MDNFPNTGFFFEKGFIDILFALAFGGVFLPFISKRNNLVSQPGKDSSLTRV